MAVPACSAQATTAKGNTSYQEQLKTGAHAYLYCNHGRVCREGLVFEGDVDSLIGAQVDLRLEVITEMEHILFHWCNTLGQLLEVTPFPWVQYDTGAVSSRGAGEDWKRAGTPQASPHAHRGAPT